MFSNKTLALGMVLVGAVASLAAGKGRTRPVELPTVEAGVLTSMPVKEVTVFKDGHAFVLHEDEVPTDSNGDVVLDTLPTPVIGTFWPYSVDAKAKLKAVVAGQRIVRTDRTALSVRELIEANPGAEARITEQGGATYSAVIMGIPKPAPMNVPASTGTPASPQSGNLAAAVASASIVMLKVNDGTKAVPIDRIQEVIFRAEPSDRLPIEEPRNIMTLRLDWAGAAPGKNANVGMMYLQKGIRWIPHYRVDIDGQGHAQLKLQATLLNEMVDLQDATVHLVIGVPSFYFKDTVDPIALQQTVAALSPYFQSGQRMGFAFSNAMQTQVLRRTEYQAPRPTESDEPEWADASKHEDLFIFTLPGVTLGKGERMVVSVAEFSLPYEDVFALDLPFAPPPELRGNIDNERSAELARMLSGPKVMHRIRLKNTSTAPLTTAPAMLLRDGKLIAQSMMSYTPTGGRSDLDLTASMDIQVVKTEVETQRTPNAETWGGNSYARIDLGGKIKLTNHRDKPVEIEVKRHVLGTISAADRDGVIEKASALEDAQSLAPGEYASWWRWYNWPGWWNGVNGFGRVTWKVKLSPGESAELTYNWHYFWR